MKLKEFTLKIAREALAEGYLDGNRKNFDPHRVASEWHSGQGSALYAYSSTDRIPTEEFKSRLVWEIEQSMDHATDEGLEDLELLLSHIEEQHPDLHPGSEMHEAWGGIDASGEESWSEDEDDADIRDLYTHGDAKDPKADRKDEQGAMCEACGAAVCECSMSESSLRALVNAMVSEMKLGVAGRGSFDFDPKRDEEDDETTSSYLSSKWSDDLDAAAAAKPATKKKRAKAKTAR